jgi:iron(III) transport system ATP-binding protein
MYLTLEHLTKTFTARAREGEVTAVDDVSLDIARGEFVTLLGPNAFVADFIGKANLLPARVVGVTADRLDLEVLGRPLSLPPANGVYRVGTPATLLVRPEAILLLERSGEGYPGRVRRAAYLGPLVEYDVDVADMALCLTQYDPRQMYPVGTEVRVQLVTEALYLLPSA